MTWSKSTKVRSTGRCCAWPIRSATAAPSSRQSIPDRRNTGVPGSRSSCLQHSPSLGGYRRHIGRRHSQGSLGVEHPIRNGRHLDGTDPFCCSPTIAISIPTFLRRHQRCHTGHLPPRRRQTPHPSRLGNCKRMGSVAAGGADTARPRHRHVRAWRQGRTARSPEGIQRTRPGHQHRAMDRRHRLRLRNTAGRDDRPPHPGDGYRLVEPSGVRTTPIAACIGSARDRRRVVKVARPVPSASGLDVDSLFVAVPPLATAGCPDGVDQCHCVFQSDSKLRRGLGPTENALSGIFACLNTVAKQSSCSRSCQGTAWKGEGLAELIRRKLRPLGGSSEPQRCDLLRDHTIGAALGRLPFLLETGPYPMDVNKPRVFGGERWTDWTAK